MQKGLAPIVIVLILAAAIVLTGGVYYLGSRIGVVIKNPVTSSVIEMPSNGKMSPDENYIITEEILGDYNKIKVADKNGRVITDDLVVDNDSAIGYNTKFRCQCTTYFKEWIDNSHFTIKIINGGGEEYEYIVNAVTGKVDESSFKKVAGIDETASWKIFDSERCKFSIKYPEGWRAKNTELVPGVDDKNYRYGCVDIYAPDFETGLDNWMGFYIFIRRTKQGEVFNSITINSLETYIKAHESILNPPMPVRNKKTMMYGNKNGIQFDQYGREDLTAFVFADKQSFYEISWPTNYKGSYADYLNKIISNVQFNN